MKSFHETGASPRPADCGRWFVWNWKGGVLSAVSRGALFLAVNITAGPQAALIAMGTQAGFRLTMGGFVSAAIERLCRTTPRWWGTTLAFTIVPLFVHSAEFLIHAGAGTPKLALGEAVSILVTLISTAFQLFAMRRGTLIAGSGGKSFWEDIATLPRLTAEFIHSAYRNAVLPIVHAGAGPTRPGRIRKSAHGIGRA